MNDRNNRNVFDFGRLWFRFTFDFQTSPRPWFLGLLLAMIRATLGRKGSLFSDPGRQEISSKKLRKRLSKWYWKMVSSLSLTDSTPDETIVVYRWAIVVVIVAVVPLSFFIQFSTPCSARQMLCRVGKRIPQSKMPILAHCCLAGCVGTAYLTVRPSAWEGSEDVRSDDDDDDREHCLTQR